MSLRDALTDLTLRLTSRAAVSWGPLPLRLIVGYGFMAHGFAKLTRGPETFATVLDTLGVPLPLVLSWATTLVELGCGATVMARRLHSARRTPNGRGAADGAVHRARPLRLLLGEARRRHR